MIQPPPAPTLPPNASILQRVRIGIQALEVLKDHPADPNYGPLFNATIDTGTYVTMARALRTTAEGRRLLDERPTLQGRELDLDALGHLPEGTLGHEFVRYFRDNKISPFETTFEIRSDMDYLSKRYRETHDLFHVITGYGTDVMGEMELQAFVLGNLRVPSAAFVLAFASVMRLESQGTSQLRGYLRRLRAAHRRGRDSRSLLSVPFETLWEQPLASLATQLCAPAEESLPEVAFPLVQAA
jgi:ubiquinone biosynthesis protein COQ4